MCTSIKLINFINIIKDTIIMLDKASININIILQILDFARNFTFVMYLFLKFFLFLYKFGDFFI